IDAAIELLVGDDGCGLVFGFGYEDQRGFVFVVDEVAIDAVVAGVELASDKPFPEWRIVGVEGGVPVLVPVEKLGVFAEAFGEMFFVETRDDSRVVEVGLADELGGWVKVFLFFPVDGDLGFVVARLVMGRFNPGLRGLLLPGFL